jgi:hypothetical protein
MRLLIVTAISMLMLTSGVFAQNNSSSATASERAKRETQELEKARSLEAQRQNSGAKGDKSVWTERGLRSAPGNAADKKYR